MTKTDIYIRISPVFQLAITLKARAPLLVEPTRKGFLMEKNGNYELLYIVHPDLESSIDKILDRVHSYIEKRGGKVNYEENWGKRKLAYEIKKSDVGIYVLCYFSAPKENIALVEKDIRLTEEIIRYMLLSYEEADRNKKTTRDTKKDKPKTESTDKVTKDTKSTKNTKGTDNKETEKERMQKIDEKLGELLGKEDNESESPKKKGAKK